VGEAQSIRAERESRPRSRGVARRAATGVAGNDPEPMGLTLTAKMDPMRVFNSSIAPSN